MLQNLILRGCQRLLPKLLFSGMLLLAGVAATAQGNGGNGVGSSVSNAGGNGANGNGNASVNNGGNNGNGSNGAGNQGLQPANTAPEFSGLPSGNILQVRCGGTVSLTITASDADPGQYAVIGVDDTLTCGVSKVIRNATTAGGVSSVTFTITGDSCNRGMHVVYLTATDNGSPARTTREILKYVITGAPSASITGPVFTCPGSEVTLTASGGNSYRWQNGATTASVRVGVGVHTVTASNAGCLTTATYVVSARDTIAPQLIGVPADTTVECDAVPAPPTVSATDNCTAGAVAYRETRTNGSCPSAYTLQRTWTVADLAGNTTSATQSITVRDTKAPSLIVADLTVGNDAGQCGALVSFSAQASDNCGTPTVSYSHQPGSFFSVGNTTVTATATDACGNQTVKTFVVTVRDEERPMVRTQNRTLQLDASGAATVNAADINNGSSDNCGIASVVLSKTSFSCSDLGANTVTLTVTDIHGNMQDATATVTVRDALAPVITTAAGALDRTLECSDAAGIAAALALVPDAADNCVSVSRRLVSDSTIMNCGTTYTRIRRWSFVDGSGNQSSVFTQTLSVVDRTAPIITANAGAIEYCFDTTSNNYTVPALAATDNCNAVSYSYNVTGANGALVRSGNSANASGAFPVGMNTISWTVRDACGNTTTATTTVRINAPITGSFSNFQVSGGSANTLYTSSYAPAASATIAITAGGGTAPYTYSWSIQSGNAAIIAAGAGTSAITATATGAGTVVFACVVTDSKGCAAIFRKTIQVIDARCGNKGDKVSVCHNTGSATNPWVQLCIAPSAVPAQLGNGSYIGNCRSNATTRTVVARESKADAAGEPTVLVYPNPTRGALQVSLAGFAGTTQLSLINTSGAQVLQRQLSADGRSSQSLDLRLLAPGVYWVRVSDARQVRTTRVVVAR